MTFEKKLHNYFQNFINILKMSRFSFQNVEHGQNLGQKFSNSADKMEY